MPNSNVTGMNKNPLQGQYTMPYSITKDDNTNKIKIAKLEYKLKRLNSVLDEIVESANIEGATQLTTGVIVKHKVEQAQKIINE